MTKTPFQMLVGFLCHFVCYFVVAFGMVHVVFKWLDHSQAEFAHIAEEHQSEQAEKAQPEYTYIAPADKAIIEMRQRE